MKLLYKIHIHRYPDDKKRKNTTHIITAWKTANSKYEYGETQFDYCCENMKTAVGFGYVIIATDKRNFNHIKYDERRGKFGEPVICLRTFDESSGYDRDESIDEWNMPISNCPFCSAKIEIELVEKKRITHTCKKTSRVVEECEDQTTEEILT